MNESSSRKDVAFRKWNNSPTFELYYQKHLMKNQDDSDQEKITVSTLIEIRKERRDWWTLLWVMIAAVVSAFGLVVSVIGLYRLN